MTRIIGSMVDSSFRRDHWGKLVFYPWGVLGKGYIVEDAALAKRIRRFLKIYYITFFGVLILSSATVGPLGILVLVPVGFIIWPIKVHLWSRQMAPTLLRRRDAKPLNG